MQTSPFRGLGADAGTVYELGYMAGRGKLCLGYSNDPSPYADRARNYTTVISQDGRLIDAHGLTVEDFGLTDNLMMIHALDLYGCALVTPRQAPIDIWRDLTAFEACVRSSRGNFPRMRLHRDLAIAPEHPVNPQARRHAAGRARPVREPGAGAGSD
jgi:hypothetical protein